MKILTLTNIYTPTVGGITRSIQTFSDQFRSRGNHVLIVAPDANDTPEEEDVVRYPAVANAYEDKYSLPIPLPGYLLSTLEEYDPDILHSHHPFLIGLTARRSAALWDVPLVYTHHTRYDAYLESRFSLPSGFVDVLAKLWTNYCNLCDAVIAPSQSIANMLQERGVDTRIEIIPTGVDLEVFASGDGTNLRRKLNIPPAAFVVGHVGRLAKEKNCEFVAEGVSEFLRQYSEAHFVLVGDGVCFDNMMHRFRDDGVDSRVHPLGQVEKKEVADAVAGMDVFAFASHTETQGMVLTEAMAAGVPVVALSASGVDDVLQDSRNGRLLADDADATAFADGLRWVADLQAEHKQLLTNNCRKTAEQFSTQNCAQRCLHLYDQVIAEHRAQHPHREGIIPATQRVLANEWNALMTALKTMGKAILS